MFNNISENRAVYEIMWKNIVEPESSPTKIRQMLISRSITRTTNTHSDYVILLSHCNSCYTKAPQFYVIRIMLSSHLRVDVLCGLFSSSYFPTKTLYVSLVSPISATLPRISPSFLSSTG